MSSADTSEPDGRPPLPPVGARVRIRHVRGSESELMLGTVVEYMDDSPYRSGVNGIVVRTDLQGIGIYPATSYWELA